MTISTTTNKITYTGNGVLIKWGYSFDVLLEGDMSLYLTEIATGIVTEITSNYTIDLDAKEVTYPSADPEEYPEAGTPLSSAYKITLAREVPYTQGVDLGEQGPFSPPVIEAALDKLTMMAIQLAEESDRSVKISISSTEDPQDLLDSITADVASATASAAAAAVSEANASAAQTAAETAETNAETAETNAETAQANAEAAFGLADTARIAAQTAQGLAETAETNAETAETNAETAQGLAETARDSATASASTATTQAGIATTQAGLAATAKTNAETAETNAETAQGLAEAARDAASGFSDSASGFADAASASATAASGSADDASGYATAASGSADDASGYATAASGSADDASGYATAASGSADDAVTAQGLAEDARDAAQTAETNAETAETNTEAFYNAITTTGLVKLRNNTGTTITAKMVKVIGDYSDDGIPLIGELAAFTDRPIAYVDSLETATNGEMIKRGRKSCTGFDCSGGSIEDKVYCNADGTLTLTPTAIEVGVIEDNSNPGIVYFNIGGSGGGGSLPGDHQRLAVMDIDGSTNAIDTDKALYTVGAGDYIKGAKLVICNRNGGYTARVRVAHIDLGGVGDVADEDYILYDDYLLPYETKIIEIDGIIPTDTILVRSNTTNVNFILTGEVLATDTGIGRVGAIEIDGSTKTVDTDYEVYTATESCKVNILVCNRNAGDPVEVQLAVIDSDDVADIADADRLFFSLDNSQTSFIEGEFNLAVDEMISFRSNYADVNCIVYRVA